MARHAGSAPASPAALRRLLPLRAAMLGAAEGDPTSKAKKQRYVAAFFFLFYLFLCFALLTPPFIKPSIAAAEGDPESKAKSCRLSPKAKRRMERLIGCHWQPPA
jgi:hypothetical protein